MLRQKKTRKMCLRQSKKKFSLFSQLLKKVSALFIFTERINTGRYSFFCEYRIAEVSSWVVHLLRARRSNVRALGGAWATALPAHSLNWLELLGWSRLDLESFLKCRYTFNEMKNRMLVGTNKHYEKGGKNPMQLFYVCYIWGNSISRFKKIKMLWLGPIYRSNVMEYPEFYHSKWNDGATMTQFIDLQFDPQ